MDAITKESGNGRGQTQIADSPSGAPWNGDMAIKMLTSKTREEMTLLIAVH